MDGTSASVRNISHEGDASVVGGIQVIKTEDDDTKPYLMAVKQEPAEEEGASDVGYAFPYEELDITYVPRVKTEYEAPNSETNDNSVMISSIKKEVEYNLPENSYKSVQDDGRSSDVHDCNIGLKKFSQASRFVSHKLIHNSEKPFVCDICTMDFSQMKDLKLHKRKHIRGDADRPNISTKCERATSEIKEDLAVNSSVKDFQQESGSGAHECNICMKKFNQTSELDSHKLIHNSEKPFACNICKMDFSQMADLKLHERRHQRTECERASCETSENSVASSSVKGVRKERGSGSHECDICKKRFSHSSNLSRHKLSHAGNKHYECNTCKKTFIEPYSLKIHTRIHTGEKPYECDICKKTFNEPRRLKAHKRIHSGQKGYECIICKKAFDDISDLKEHKRTHLVEECFQCDICKKVFPHASTLVVHKRTHNGEKPYTCSICQKAFNNASSLKVHKRIHSGEKPYMCNVCNKEFNNASNLNTHKRIHSDVKPHKCDVCTKAFHHVSSLISHKAIHSDEKRFECNICKKAFNQIANLIAHKRIHSGEKPYECKVCIRAFNQASSLKRHMRIH